MSNAVRNCIAGNLSLDILNFKLLNVNTMENLILMYYTIYFGVYPDFRTIRYPQLSLSTLTPNLYNLTNS